MDLAAVHTRIDEVGAFDRLCATLAETKAGLSAVHAARGWLQARELEMTQRLKNVSSFPENDLATASRTRQKSATTVMKRAETVSRMPEFGDRLSDGDISTEHLDAVTRAYRGLKPQDRDLFAQRSGRLALIAGNSTPEEFEKTVQREADSITAEDGTDRLTRQKTAARVRTWVNKAGMWCIYGQLDAETGIKIGGRLEALVASKFANKIPDGAPDDPEEKADWLRAQAFIAMVSGEQTVNVGRPEAVVIVDSTTGTIRWPFNVSLPDEALQRFLKLADVHFIDVHCGNIRHAPGNLNLGRTTRLANRAQRRAMSALYATCAIPGCCVRYENTKLHHVRWWRHGGTTDFANLLPLCNRHHHLVHEGGWKLTLTPDRTLTITLPDGRTMSTGPPGTIAA
jgi:hypothetical protein